MRILEKVGDKLAGAYNRFAGRMSEHRLGIQTEGLKDTSFSDAKKYAYVAYGSIFKTLHRLALRVDDVFVDIGCGKGRVVCCTATLWPRKVVGIDVETDFCEIAHSNAAAVNGRKSEVEITNLPAQQYNYRDCTAFFLFNSFGEATLRETLASIERSIAENTRCVRIAYVNSIHGNVLRESRVFSHVETWVRRPVSRDKFAVSFWKTLG